MAKSWLIDNAGVFTWDIETRLRKLKQTIPIRRDGFVIVELLCRFIIAHCHILLMLTFPLQSWGYYSRTPLKNLPHHKFVQPE